jgi:hypothetical protein
MKKPLGFFRFEIYKYSWFVGVKKLVHTVGVTLGRRLKKSVHFFYFNL